MITCIKNRKLVSNMIRSLDEDDLIRIEMNDKDDSYFDDVGLDVYLFKDGDNEIGFFGLWGINDEYCQTPLFINKKYRSKGYGKKLVGLAEEEAFNEGYAQVLHRIKKDNIRMMSLSKSCDYSYLSNDSDYVLMSKERGL